MEWELFKDFWNKRQQISKKWKNIYENVLDKRGKRKKVTYRVALAPLLLFSTYTTNIHILESENVIDL